MRSKLVFALFLTSLLLLCLAPPRAAATAVADKRYTVQYVEGDVSVLIEGTWREVEIGDVLSSELTVKVGINSYLEFGDGHSIIGISAAGTFKLSALVSKAAAVRSSDSGVMDKLKALVENPRASSTVAAVRGENAGAAGAGSGFDYGDEEEPPLGWEARYERAHALLKAGDSDEAYAEFDAIALGGEEPFASSAAYCAAMTLARQGELARAIRYLRAFAARPEMSAYGPCLLALARLDLETGSLEEARALLEEALLSGRLTREELDLAEALKKLLP